MRTVAIGVALAFAVVPAIAQTDTQKYPGQQYDPGSGEAWRESQRLQRAKPEMAYPRTDASAWPMYMICTDGSLPNVKSRRRLIPRGPSPTSGPTARPRS